MSLRRHILNQMMRLVEKRHLARVDDTATLRASFERKARFWLRPPRGSHFSQEVFDSVPVCWALGRDVPARSTGPVILYLHGGGYVFGSSRTHRAVLARLSGLSGLPACLPDYRLAPEHPFPAALEDALAVYIELSGEREVIIGGDSAGGGLALALLGEILRHGLRRPRGVFCFSPLTDMTFSGESMVTNADADVMLPVNRASELARMYLRESDPRDPRASPLFASFRGAPPVWMAAGDTEILLDDTRRMAARLRADGVRVKEVIARDLPHAWPVFGWLLPEAGRTLDEVASWINSLSRPQGDS